MFLSPWRCKIELKANKIFCPDPRVSALKMQYFELIDILR